MAERATAARRVAIACQGGGSHTAFTAGVLKGLLTADALAGHRVVAISGTSGGAVCALLAWQGLRRGDPAAAVAGLEAFWRDNAAAAPPEQVANAWLLWASRLQHVVSLPAVSPYDNPFAPLGLDRFRAMLERRVDFAGIEVQGPDEDPMLLIGAVDVRTGDFRAFNSRRERITPEAVLASAAIPNLFRAVPVGDGLYWDGLFSQNPPVRELLDAAPDEVWVIQINPRERPAEPRSVVDIADRRNELAGNLSLYQELHFIERIDHMLEDGVLSPESGYRPVVVRVIELVRPASSMRHGAASKLDRDPAFLRALIAHGEARAAEFLASLAFEDAWRSRRADRIMALLHDDAEVVSAPPFTAAGPLRGHAEIRPFVDRHLARTVRVDPTRKQVARDRVTWSVRVRRRGGATGEGRAEAAFRDGRVAALALGPEAAR